MLLTLKYNLNSMKNKQKEIIQDLMWHSTKVYNTLLYEIENKCRYKWKFKYTKKIYKEK